jgi:hypothetical protein
MADNDPLRAAFQASRARSEQFVRRLFARWGLTPMPPAPAPDDDDDPDNDAAPETALFG